MADQVPYDPYNPSGQQQPGYPTPAAPVATFDPTQGGQPPQYPPPDYNQYQQPAQPPKKKKTLFIVLGIVGALLLCCCLAVVGFAWIGYSTYEPTPAPLPTSPTEPVTPDPVPTPKSTPDPTGEDDFTDTKKVGNDAVGYLEVPTTWVIFQDVDGNPSTQFSNATGDQIVTLYGYPTDEVSAKDYADSVYFGFEERGAKDLTGATVSDIPGYTAYQVYGLLDDVMLVAWVFEDGEGTTHYICVEGPLIGTPYEVYEIPQSFTLR